MISVLKRLSITVVVALVVAVAASSIVFAGGPYYITENSLYWIMGPQTAPVVQYHNGCAGGRCRYLYQSDYSSVYRWAWTRDDVYLWYAFCPTIGEAAAKYGVRISGSPNWDIVMNQANPSNQGKYVYLGYSDYTDNNGGYLMLHNGCVDGYWCGGLKVFWDNMKYTTQ